MPLCPNGSATIEWQYPGEAKNRIIGADEYLIRGVHPQPTKYIWQYDISQAHSSFGSVDLNDPKRGCGGVNRYHTTCSIYSRRTHVGFDGSRRASACYAPIYAYRVVDLAASTFPCNPVSTATPSQLVCAIVSGYKKIQILCHGINNTYSPNAAWFTAWWDNDQFAPQAGTVLKVPYETQQLVVYDPSINTYVGNLDPGYDWQYFKFVPTTNSPSSQVAFEIFKNNQVVYSRTSPTSPIVTHFCGEQCPPGTCECENGSIVCCYDTSTGKAVKSFRR
jgi:hypothetical protein